MEANYVSSLASLGILIIIFNNNFQLLFLIPAQCFLNFFFSQAWLSYLVMLDCLVGVLNSYVEALSGWVGFIGDWLEGLPMGHPQCQNV